MTDVPSTPPDGASESIAPGWYPTADGQWLRYHDGIQWTEHATPAGHTEKTAVPFWKVWLIASGVWLVINILAVDTTEGAAYATGQAIAALIIAGILGALTALPIAWLINRNRTRH